MVRVIFILSLCFFYILLQFYPNKFLEQLYTLAALFVFISLLPLLERGKKWFILTLFTIGVVIHIANGHFGLNLFQGITQNMSLVSIIIFAPLLSIPLKREGIMDTVIFFLKKLSLNPRKAYAGITLFMLALGPILNMGSIRIVHSFIEKISFSPKMISRAYFAGFSPAFVWSPFFACVGINLFYLDLDYLSYAFIGISFAFIQVFIGLLLFRPKFHTVEHVEERIVESSKYKRTHIYILVAFVVGLITVLIILEQFVQKSMLLLVSIVSIAVPCLWVITRKKWGIVKEEATLFAANLLKQKTEICIFLCAGLFGHALSATPVKDCLTMLMQWSATQSIGVLFIFIFVIITFFAYLGVHQIIVIPLLISSIDFSLFHVSKEIVAFMGIFSWMLSSNISPLNATNIIISSCVKANGLKVAYKWNGWYFLTVFVAAFLYIYLLYYLKI